MRRLIIEEPYSAAAVWSRRLAIFAIVLGLMDIGLARANVVEVPAIIAIFGAVIFIACTALLLAGSAAVIIWNTGRRGAGVTVGALFLTALLLAYPTYLAALGVRLPRINDVSTDLNDPPSYSLSSRARQVRNGQDHPEVSLTWRDEQRRAYPDIQPIVLDVESDEAYQIVQKAIAIKGWRIIEQRAPIGPVGSARIDALDRTFIMGFPEDVVVRLQPLPGQTRIDVRSASRYGNHDFGGNARRIARFAEELQNQLDSK